MPTSPAGTKKLRPTFMFYREGGKHRDAALHEEILAEGDHVAALEVSREVAARLGSTPEEIELMLGGEVMADAIARTKDYNPYHRGKGPRGGQFTSKAGASAASVAQWEAEQRVYKGFKPGVAISGDGPTIKPTKTEWLENSPIVGIDMDGVIAAGAGAQRLLVAVGKEVSKTLGFDFINPGPKRNRARDRKSTRLNS